ncbi:DsbA family oxidoreductase [Aliifodinibius sp. 1BSP15-2V2]|uniref:DsbA family oxidoreductase n=1 Tax=Fodinibius salsisoli TaxID=2820877 RepID=A0ABT3PKH1_9BACT|nr:DsbA family oxidoreductase [Fodinibius salsisoli]MCW9706440.1 DsbA family oxidoreductase [Fodinibius salsisoli]
MKIEIWSDIMCPFCYIGKRRLEKALDQFDHSDDIALEWKSYQLNPDMKTDADANINEYLAQTKGWSVAHAQQMNQRVTDMAAAEGLEYNMDEAVVANSFQAHTLIQYAKSQSLGDEAEEALFEAYFIKSRNIDDTETLLDIAVQVGLDPDESHKALSSDTYAEAVKADIQEARNMRVRGVPFFLLNKKYSISGAQDTDIFLQALNKVWKEWNEQQDTVELSEQSDAACDVDGNC